MTPHSSPTLAVAVSGLLMWTAASAASLHVSPVNLRMDAGQQATGLTLANRSDQPLVSQVRVFAWTQGHGEDELSAQRDVVASPPIATIPAHGEQLVRVIRLNQSKPAKELSYRLVVDELPDPAAQIGAGAVDIRIRYSIPLFVVPPGAAAEPRLRWELTHRDGIAYMRVTNFGGLHAQLSAVKILRADGSQSNVAPGLLGYALAGSGRDWQLGGEGFAGTDTLRISALVNGAPIEVQAVVSQTVAAQ